MAFRLVAKSGWRNVSLPPEFYEKGGTEGLICIDELTDYELVKGEHLADNKSKVIAYLLRNLVISPISLARWRILLLLFMATCSFHVSHQKVKRRTLNNPKLHSV